jgi:hypothetical protein
MPRKPKGRIFLGKCEMQITDNPVAGEFVRSDGESFYKISGYNKMDPFFMTVVSNSDHWMFISSNGALTAGRKNPDHALFPYYTVDKIHDSPEITGSKTIFLLNREGRTYLWEPFSDRYSGVYRLKRNIYKSIYGNKIIFEEINEDLEARFSYSWMNSERFGFIKKSILTNCGKTTCSVSVLDGIQNILPSGLNRLLQLSFSNLVDAYKKNELLDYNNIALFMLSSIIVDRAEPSEALSATVVWSEGLQDAGILLSSRQLEDFRKGNIVETERDIRAERGAYFVNADLVLEQGAEKEWHIVADVNKNAGYIASLKHLLSGENKISELIQNDVAGCTNELAGIIASADGLQQTEDKMTVCRHMSNVLFNVMRGGIFENGYLISKKDLLQYISGANKSVYARNRSMLESINENLTIQHLIKLSTNADDPQLTRLFYEYLPLALSRRHGDPSRPWNIFSIELKKEDGSKNLNYQGNWRDIFQNWEALALSYPSFAESMICKFLNASTADGYNPYRITRDGIEWEVPDPHDPWASIGYWGDHQVIYLLKLLEISNQYHPHELKKMLPENIFAYADVPYRIKKYEELVKNPFNTIDFDYRAEKASLERVAGTGSDGKLIPDQKGEVKLVNLTEKILVNLLARLSNFIPEAGIWMNTQRPEWNDANNALVGNGASMVTLYYVRRLLKFLTELFRDEQGSNFELSAEVCLFFNSINTTFIQYEDLSGREFSDRERKLITDLLGKAGSDYRLNLYKNGFSGKKNSITPDKLTRFFELTLKFIDQSIRRNKRPDNLYHAYNLVSFKDDGIAIRHLYEMLEGQVAILSAGYLKPVEVIEVLDALKLSSMFRNDQYSYLLYPDRQLPRFTEKNIIPPALVKGSKLLVEMLIREDKNILYGDADGLYHFNSNFRNASYLKNSLAKAEAEYRPDQSEKDYILEVFEKVFDHQTFTGRSGTFYGFEGLGCIYWHMVSKLLLAINENYINFFKSGNKNLLTKLVRHYYDVRAGIGLNKLPDVYGAFPTDAYSHTPGHGGAKQPGMTGQVKEDIISRFGELGLIVESGRITFNGGLLRRSEFLTSGGDFHYLSSGNKEILLPLEKESLAFTFCQTPVIYHISGSNKIRITATESTSESDGLILDEATSSEIFNRTGSVKQLEVFLTPALD